MRITALSAAAALMVLSLSTSLMAQRPDTKIDPRSLALLEQGQAARAAGDLDAAEDAIESALVVDPRNRQGFIVLAEIAQGRQLPGKALSLYREALALGPTDVAALRGQGEALVAKGAMEKARENLAKIRTLCRAECGDAATLAATIAKGPPPTTTAQSEVATPPAPQPN